jgi:hypothetical protein
MTCSAPGDVNCEINGLVTDVWHVTTTVVLTDL